MRAFIIPTGKRISDECFIKKRKFDGSLNELPILTKLGESYKAWHDFLARIPRLSRFTLGTKIDGLFTDCLELAVLAGFTARGEKLQIIQRLSNKFK